MYQKSGSAGRSKKCLSQMNLGDILKYDADSEEGTGETPVEIPDEIEKAVPEIILPGSW